jgi:hypothetical protein
MPRFDSHMDLSICDSLVPIFGPRIDTNAKFHSIASNSCCSTVLYPVWLVAATPESALSTSLTVLHVTSRLPPTPSRYFQLRGDAPFCLRSS